MHPDNADKEEPKPTQEDMDRLILIHTKLEIFDTPKAIADREKLQKRIDEAEAETSEK